MRRFDHSRSQHAAGVARFGNAVGCMSYAGTRSAVPTLWAHIDPKTARPRRPEVTSP